MRPEKYDDTAAGGLNRPGRCQTMMTLLSRESRRNGQLPGLGHSGRYPSRRHGGSEEAAGALAAEPLQLLEYGQC